VSSGGQNACPRPTRSGRTQRIHFGREGGWTNERGIPRNESGPIWICRSGCLPACSPWKTQSASGRPAIFAGELSCGSRRKYLTRTTPRERDFNYFTCYTCVPIAIFLCEISRSPWFLSHSGLSIDSTFARRSKSTTTVHQQVGSDVRATKPARARNVNNMTLVKYENRPRWNVHATHPLVRGYFWRSRKTNTRDSRPCAPRVTKLAAVVVVVVVG